MTYMQYVPVPVGVSVVLVALQISSALGPGSFIWKSRHIATICAAIGFHRKGPVNTGTTACKWEFEAYAESD